MAKRRKEVKLESTEEKIEVVKKLLLSFIVFLVASITYMMLANIIIKNVDDKVDKIDLPEISKFNMNSHIISVNGIKSPSLDVEVLTTKPSRMVIEVRGPDFFRRVNSPTYETDFAFNLVLPDNLIGENVDLTLKLYDELSREQMYSKSYKIPALSPSITVN